MKPPSETRRQTKASTPELRSKGNSFYGFLLFSGVCYGTAHAAPSVMLDLATPCRQPVGT